MKKNIECQTTIDSAEGVDGQNNWSQWLDVSIYIRVSITSEIIQLHWTNPFTRAFCHFWAKHISRGDTKHPKNKKHSSADEEKKVWLQNADTNVQAHIDEHTTVDHWQDCFWKFGESINPNSKWVVPLDFIA